VTHGRTVALALALALAWLAPAAPALAQTPEPPSVHLDAPRFDAARGVYLLDFVYTRTEAIGSLQVTVVDDQGVEVARLTFTPQGRNQSVELDAAALQPGQNYTLEVIGFDSGGKLIGGGQGEPVLASRGFTHLPSALQLGEPRFRLDSAAPALVIELSQNGAAPVAAYRVILAGSQSNAVVLDTQTAGPPPLTIPLDGVPGGDYRVTLIALDAQGAELAQAEGELSYAAGALQLGEPLFEYRVDPPALLVRLQPTDPAAAAGYNVVLIDSDTNQVAAEHDLPAGEGTLVVPVEDLPAGDYLVQVRALDAAGAELARAEGETTYVPPSPPGAFTRIAQGLAANPFIPILIALVVLGLIGFLALTVIWGRRATATPLFQAWGITSRPAGGLPVQPAVPDTPLAAPRPMPAGRMQIVVEATPDTAAAGRTIELTRLPFSVGRGGCDLNLDGDGRISTRHAEFRLAPEGLAVVDLGSRNGTFVDGRRLAPGVAAPLRNAARVGLGKHTRLVVKM
jgi:hypothetical protein